jgi:2,3-dihydroxybenzoate-AMP ligase
MPPLVLIWLEVIEDYLVDLSRMILQVGSARFAPELAKRVRTELGCRLSHWFGMAEGLLTCTRLDDAQDIIETTQGRPICPDDELMVVDEEGEPVPPGGVGELITRGPYTLRGYYKAAAHNAQAFTADGFLRTGDLVRITADGNLVVEGRIKDVINRGGEKIVASEIEDALATHPGIREVALVALPDTTMGEKSCVCIVAREPAPSLQQIKDFLRDRGFATYKLPDLIQVLDTMPRTSAGKLNKAELRRRYSG